MVNFNNLFTQTANVEEKNKNSEVLALSVMPWETASPGELNHVKGGDKMT